MGLGYSSNCNKPGIDNETLRRHLRELLNTEKCRDSSNGTLGWYYSEKKPYQSELSNFDNKFIQFMTLKNYDKKRALSPAYNSYGGSRIQQRNRYDEYDGMNGTMSNLMHDFGKFNFDDQNSITSDLSELREIKDNLKKRMQNEITLAGGGLKNSSCSDEQSSSAVSSNDSEETSETSETSDESQMSGGSDINVTPFTMNGGGHKISKQTCNQPLFYSSDSTSEYFKHLHAGFHK